MENVLKRKVYVGADRAAVITLLYDEALFGTDTVEGRSALHHHEGSTLAHDKAPADTEKKENIRILLIGFEAPQVLTLSNRLLRVCESST